MREITHRERRHKPTPLTGDAKSLAAVGKDPKARASSQKGVCELGAGVYEVPAVV